MATHTTPEVERRFRQLRADMHEAITTTEFALRRAIRRIGASLAEDARRTPADRERRALEARALLLRHANRSEAPDGR